MIAAKMSISARQGIAGCATQSYNQLDHTLCVSSKSLLPLQLNLTGCSDVAGHPVKSPCHSPSTFRTCIGHGLIQQDLINALKQYTDRHRHRQKQGHVIITAVKRTQSWAEEGREQHACSARSRKECVGYLHLQLCIERHVV